jgi:hypothetical protein
MTTLAAKVVRARSGGETEEIDNAEDTDLGSTEADLLFQEIFGEFCEPREQVMLPITLNEQDKAIGGDPLRPINLPCRHEVISSLSALSLMGTNSNLGNWDIDKNDPGIYEPVDSDATSRQLTESSPSSSAMYLKQQNLYKYRGRDSDSSSHKYGDYVVNLAGRHDKDARLIIESRTGEIEVFSSDCIAAIYDKSTGELVGTKDDPENLLGEQRRYFRIHLSDSDIGRGGNANVEVDILAVQLHPDEARRSQLMDHLVLGGRITWISAGGPSQHLVADASEADEDMIASAQDFFKLSDGEIGSRRNLSNRDLVKAITRKLIAEGGIS